MFDLNYWLESPDRLLVKVIFHVLVDGSTGPIARLLVFLTTNNFIV